MFNILNIKNSIILLIIILFYFLFNFNFDQLEFYYDDYWFVSSFRNNNDLFTNFIKLKEYYIVRPIGLTYLSLLSVIESEKLGIYYLINIFIWLISSLILYLSFAKIINKKFALIFFFLILFPSISSAFLFSPIIQGLSTISIFFWSLSIYFLSKNKGLTNTLISIIFLALSFLSYEISFSLIPINIFVYCYFNNIFSNNIKYIFYKIIKISFFSIILVLLFYFFQKFVSLYSEANLIKYGFNEADFLINAKKYLFTPFKILYYEIPKLWIDGAVKTLSKINYFLYFLILFLNLILYLIIFNKKTIVNKISFKILFIFNLTLAFVFVGIFLIYLIATSVPDVTGYYSRGLLCLHILFAIFLSQMVFTRNKFVIFFTFLIFNLNFMSLSQKFLIHLEYGKERKKIIEATKKLANVNKVVFTNFNTFKTENYNLIPIFSDEVFDYSNAINFYTKSKILAHRIYKKEECKKILYYENSILTGNVPSRNRKFTEDQNISFMKISKEEIKKTSIVIFDYNKKKYIEGKINNLDFLLKSVFDCI